MRIAIVCPYDLTEYGGVQSVVLDLVSRLGAGGDEAFVVGPGAGAHGGIDVGPSVTIPGNGSNAPIALGLGVRRRVREAVGDADVVHVHEPMMPVTSISALGTSTPTVATFHAAVAPWTATLYRGFERLGSRLLGEAALTAVSPVAAAGLPHAWSPVAIVPNGIEVRSFRLDVPKVTGRIVVVGRDEPRKGLDVALEAVPAIRERRGDAELHVIGAIRPPVDGVVFHGRVDDIAKRELLASAEIYVAPHLGGESFGIVIAEAMAAGCAVVASALPAFQAVGGDAARHVPVADPTAVARAVIDIWESEGQLERMIEAGTARAESYDWSVVVDRYRELYDRVANIGM